ncbi:hypothetical protein ACGFMK_29960 [Amycolatopsis sp. NPDC049252]|uniref:hypothetical protein n=1 Tax=Amycolatopsis sp. NPDC049252 TaxID=3363933 RepID=UPI00371315EA
MTTRWPSAGATWHVPARIGDRTGYWVTANPGDPINGGDAYLRWLTADGRWAELHGYYLDFPEVRQSLLRVAGEVTFGNKPVPLPLHVSSLPPGFHLADGQLWRRPDQDGTPWKLQLYYSVNGATVVIEVAPPGGVPAEEGQPEVHHEERAEGVRHRRPPGGRGAGPDRRPPGPARPDHPARARREELDHARDRLSVRVRDPSPAGSPGAPSHPGPGGS